MKLAVQITLWLLVAVHALIAGVAIYESFDGMGPGIVWFAVLEVITVFALIELAMRGLW